MSSVYEWSGSAWVLTTNSPSLDGIQLAVYNNTLYALGKSSGSPLYAYQSGKWVNTGQTGGAMAVYNNALYLATSSGMMVYNGSTWTAGVGISNAQIYEMRAVGNRLLATGFMGGHIWSFNGSAWTMIEDNSGWTLYSMGGVNGSVVASFSIYNSSTGTSSNSTETYNGSTWAPYTPAPAPLWRWGVYNNMPLAASGTTQVIYQYESGTWVQMSSAGLTTSSASPQVLGWAVVNGVLYAATNYGVYRYTP